MSSSNFHRCTRDEFLAEFYPDPADKADIAAGDGSAARRAARLPARRDAPPPRHHPGPGRYPDGHHPRTRVPAIEHAKPGTTELRTLAAYVEALGDRLELIADFGDQRLAFTEPGTEAV